jgi:hypothetical protein
MESSKIFAHKTYYYDNIFGSILSRTQACIFETLLNFRLLVPFMASFREKYFRFSKVPFSIFGPKIWFSQKTSKNKFSKSVFYIFSSFKNTSRHVTFQNLCKIDAP